jgi:molybdate transport system substrate-binding protein
VLVKVTLGEADAGIVYHSDLVDPSSRDLKIIVIPNEFNPLVEYQAAPLLDAANRLGSEKFLEVLLSGTGQEILTRNGFLPR